MNAVESIEETLGTDVAALIDGLPDEIQSVISIYLEEQLSVYEQSAEVEAKAEAMRLYIEHINAGREAVLAKALRQIEGEIEQLVDDIKRHEMLDMRVGRGVYIERLNAILDDVDVVAAMSVCNAA